MSNLPRDEAYVIAIWLATLLFGIHIVVFILFIWACRQRSSPNAPVPAVNMHLVITATAMLVIGFVNNIVGLQRVITAFWGHTGESSAEYLNNTRVVSNFVESITWFLQVTLGDGFLTYRCWVIYGKRWRALILPAALVLATFCMGILLQIEYGQVHQNASNMERTRDLFRWEAAMLTLTVALNIALTIAIALRIWWQYRQVGHGVYGLRQARHMHIIWLIIESGMLVALAQTLVLVLGAFGNSGYQIVVHAVNPLIGIVFTGIIVRVQLAAPSPEFSSDIPPLDTIVLTDTIQSNGEDLQDRLVSYEGKPSAHDVDISLRMKAHRSRHDHDPEIQDIELSDIR